MKKIKRRALNAIVFIMVPCMAAALIAGTALGGPPGSLDPSLAGTGVVITDILNRDAAVDVAAGPDGTIIVAGTCDMSAETQDPGFTVVRYRNDGSLDNTFDGDGVAITPFPGNGTRAAAAAIQENGRILVTGSSGPYGSTNLTVVRYITTGALDTTFSGDGILTTAAGGSYNWGEALVIQADGKVVVAGTSWISDYDFVLTRCNADGSLDAGFGSSGTVTLDLGDWDFCHTVALQQDGKIVAAGRSRTGANYAIALVRFNSNGALDTTFGNAGTVITDVTDGFDAINALALQTDGRIVGAGLTSGGALTIVRYTATGSLDATFSGNGIAVIPTGNEARDIVIQPDGKIVAVATQGDADHLDLSLVRYLPDGSLDPNFGNAGMVVINLGGDYDEAGGVTLQAGSRILAVGTLISDTAHDIAVLRLFGAAPVTVPSQFLLLE
jgi:uncharacterized delta-60 repeat protein